MGLFTRNEERNQEENGDLENMSREFKQNLAELQCEEAIMKDKERFGRVRMNMMKVLRSEHGDDIANRALGRVNKRLQEGYFNQ